MAFYSQYLKEEKKYHCNIKMVLFFTIYAYTSPVKVGGYKPSLFLSFIIKRFRVTNTHSDEFSYFRKK